MHFKTVPKLQKMPKMPSTKNFFTFGPIFVSLLSKCLLMTIDCKFCHKHGYLDKMVLKKISTIIAKHRQNAPNILLVLYVSWNEG